MGILDSIVGWIAEQIMNLLDLTTGAVLGALGCDMSVFLRYFPAAETMYDIFVAIGIGFILLNLVWQLFKNYGAGIGLSAEDPGKLLLRSSFCSWPIFRTKSWPSSSNLPARRTLGSLTLLYRLSSLRILRVF